MGIIFGNITPWPEYIDLPWVMSLKGACLEGHCDSVELIGDKKLKPDEALKLLNSIDEKHWLTLFLSVRGYGYGYGYGDGYGNGNGYGDGDGYGDGGGYGKGDGNGYGDGDGYGDGYGYGKGDGNGYGDGDGYGYGKGCDNDDCHSE